MRGVVYYRKQSRKIDMRTATIVKKGKGLLLKLCIEYVMKLCESGMRSVGRLCYGEL